jgi:hypothetical protein
MMKVLMKIKKTIKAFCDVIVFALSHKGDIATEAVDEGLCDYSGQGRNEYGK